MKAAAIEQTHVKVKQLRTGQTQWQNKSLQAHVAQHHQTSPLPKQSSAFFSACPDATQKTPFLTSMDHPATNPRPWHGISTKQQRVLAVKAATT